MDEGVWNCKKCDIIIDGHNQYLHDGMCDTCFFQTYFPEDQKAYEKRIIKIGAKNIDPVGLSGEDIEKALCLTEYIETKEGREDQEYVDAFLLFLERVGFPEINMFHLYEGEITGVSYPRLATIKKNLYLMCKDEGSFFDEDIYVSQAFTDNKTFFCIVQEGILFFSGNKESTEIMRGILSTGKIGFFLESLDEYLS